MLIDLAIDVQTTEIYFDPETYEPLTIYQPVATRAQIERAMDLLAAAERPLIVAGVASSTPRPPTCWWGSPN